MGSKNHFVKIIFDLKYYLDKFFYSFIWQKHKNSKTTYKCNIRKYNKNLIFQLFKTKGLAKTEKFISPRKGVKSAHDFSSEFVSYYVGNGACS